MRLVTAVVIAMAAGADGAAAGFAADAPTRKPVARYDAASYQPVRRSIIKAPSHSGPLHDSASTLLPTLRKLQPLSIGHEHWHELRYCVI
jgi:hypothetical protein